MGSGCGIVVKVLDSGSAGLRTQGFDPHTGHGSLLKSNFINPQNLEAIRQEKTTRETTWTNTGATRYGRVQLKTRQLGYCKRMPSPNHGTLRLPNDEDDGYCIVLNWKTGRGYQGCDRRISLRVKRKVYKTIVKPAMIYGAETWAVKKAQEKKLDVTEMRMLLRWMNGVAKLDRIRNERMRGTTKMGEISKKVEESRLRWYRLF